MINNEQSKETLMRHYEKEPELRSLITQLEADLGPNSIETVDDWQEDLIAIGVRRPGDGSRLVYVALELVEGGELRDSDDRFYFESEIARADDPVPYEVAERGVHMTYDELRAAIKRHLKL
jgi:hypothetical protein